MSSDCASCALGMWPGPKVVGSGGGGDYSGFAKDKEGVLHSRRSLGSSAQHLLSSRVLCSTFSERTLTFSMVLRGRRGVMRLTAAVLRKRLARPRVGELSQPARGRGSAPPMARACMGRCGGERGSEANQLSRTGAYEGCSGCTGGGDGGVGGWTWRGHAPPAARELPCEKVLSYRERGWTCVIPLPTR